MNSIEKMRWAKDLISEKSGGSFELAVGNIHGDLYLRCSDQTNAGLYLSVQPNLKSGQLDCVFKGYTRCSGGYNNAKQMQQLAGEYQMVAGLVKELEAAKITLTEDELLAFSAEMKSAEEEQTNAPQMGI